jgi:hypothetical protein
MSCTKKVEYGYVRLSFEHHWDNSPIIIDDKDVTNFPYTNAAGNQLRFTNLEYFISDLRFSGLDEPFKHPQNIRYINNDSAHRIILLTYQIPVGSYNKIHFMFGLKPVDNKSNSLPNYQNMSWPDNMGGGYHYMKIDGFFIDREGKREGFGLHLGSWYGITRYEHVWGVDGTGLPIIVDSTPVRERFNHNFAVEVNREFKVEAHKITTVDPIIMDVKQWMQEPNILDFNVIGDKNDVMSNRETLEKLMLNGQYFNRIPGVFK